jgi:GDPmannose 4,6-dehydratase
MLVYSGIGGQDGYYLACHLLGLGYVVHGLMRGLPGRRPKLTALQSQHDGSLILHSGDILDLACLITLLGKIKVDEIYHLAAQTHVGISFQQLVYTYDVNSLGTIRLLEAITVLKMTKSVRFYNASHNYFASWRLFLHLDRLAARRFLVMSSRHLNERQPCSTRFHLTEHPSF